MRTSLLLLLTALFVIFVGTALAQGPGSYAVGDEVTIYLDGAWHDGTVSEVHDDGSYGVTIQIPANRIAPKAAAEAAGITVEAAIEAPAAAAKTFTIGDEVKFDIGGEWHTANIIAKSALGDFYDVESCTTETVPLVDQSGKVIGETELEECSIWPALPASDLYYITETLVTEVQAAPAVPEEQIVTTTAIPVAETLGEGANLKKVWKIEAQVGDLVVVNTNVSALSARLMDEANYQAAKNGGSAGGPWYKEQSADGTDRTYEIPQTGTWYVMFSYNGFSGVEKHDPESLCAWNYTCTEEVEFEVEVSHIPQNKQIKIAAAPEYGDLAGPAEALQALQQEINRVRREIGDCTTDLNFDPQLDLAAQSHSMNMAIDDFSGHTGLDGSTHEQRIYAAGFPLQGASGEIISYGRSTAAEAVQSWLDSTKGHRENMLNCDWQYAGAGAYYRANDPGTYQYRYYWTVVFAGGKAQ